MKTTDNDRPQCPYCGETLWPWYDSENRLTWVHRWMIDEYRKLEL